MGGQLTSWNLNDAKHELKKCIVLEFEAQNEVLNTVVGSEDRIVAEQIWESCKRRTRQARKRIQDAVNDL